MSKINPNASSLIDDYIEKLPLFSKDICNKLREVIHKADNSVIEDWKWKSPVFHKKEMVCAFSGFKNHVSLSFFNGASMSNKHQLFTDGCSGKNMRIIKYSKSSEINEIQLIEYFKEAFLQTNVKSKSPTIKSEFEIPNLLQNALNKNKLAKTNFENMAYTYRKEYALHISEAKREVTKLKRLEKVILNLEQNIKMHEQYKC